MIRVLVFALSLPTAVLGTLGTRNLAWHMARAPRRPTGLCPAPDTWSQLSQTPGTGSTQGEGGDHPHPGASTEAPRGKGPMTRPRVRECHPPKGSRPSTCHTPQMVQIPKAQHSRRSSWYPQRMRIIRSRPRIWGPGQSHCTPCASRASLTVLTGPATSHHPLARATHVKPLGTAWPTWAP